MGSRNFISRVYCIATSHMPRNFSELKSGAGTIPMLSPHAEMWGERVPPLPPPIDACARAYKQYQHKVSN